MIHASPNIALNVDQGSEVLSRDHCLYLKTTVVFQLPTTFHRQGPPSPYHHGFPSHKSQPVHIRPSRSHRRFRGIFCALVLDKLARRKNGDALMSIDTPRHEASFWHNHSEKRCTQEHDIQSMWPSWRFHRSCLQINSHEIYKVKNLVGRDEYIQTTCF